MGAPDFVAIVATVGGVVFMLVSLSDAAVTVLHADVEGPAARAAQGAAWRALRTRGRRAQAAAGPIMLVATFFVWVSLLVLGYALALWPYLTTSFRAAPELGSPGFAEALYHSGITVTVLGYGDLTPLSWPLQLLSVVASGGGFVLLTAIATYMIQLVGGISPRARFALLALDETHGTSDGVQLVIDRLDAESVDRFDDELQRWATMVRETDEGLHRHPRVGLLFRSLDPARDPEPAMAVALELAAAAQVVSDDPSYRYLRPRARSLADAGDRLIRVVSAQHLPRAARAALDRDPDEASHAAATRLVRRLRDGGRLHLADDARSAQSIAGALHRRRVFLDAMHDLTCWEDHLGMQQQALAHGHLR